MEKEKKNENEMDPISVDEYLRRRGMLQKQKENSEEQQDSYSSLSMSLLSMFSASSLCVTL